MVSLRERLSRSRPEEQEAELARHADEASDAELVDLVVTPPEPVAPFVPYELAARLTVRGPGALPAIAAGMAAQPLDMSARRLARVLADIEVRHPDQAREVTSILLETVERALDGGGDTWVVGELLGWCLSIVEVHPDLAWSTGPLARRVLGVAATEDRPYSLAIDRAQELLRRSGQAR